MNQVWIISATQVNWETFIDCCLSAFGTSPTQELDLHKVMLDNQTSYVKALEVLNKRPEAIEDLKKASRSLDFVHLTFFISFDDADLFDQFCNLAGLCQVTYQDKIGLFCGSLKQIKELIVVGCDRKMAREIRLTCNKMFVHLDLAGYRSMFKPKVVLPDDTFTF